MHLIHFIERIAGEDKWYPREDLTRYSPAEWLIRRRLSEADRGGVTDVLLVSATPISDEEGQAIAQATRDLLAARGAAQAGTKGST